MPRMKNPRASLTARVLGAIACACAIAAHGAAAPKFDKLVDDFVFENLALSPSTATQVGYHRHHTVVLDDLLDDYSPAGIAAQQAFLTAMDARIAGFDLKSLEPEQRADIDIMRDALRATRLELDEIQSYRHNPTVYVELVGNALDTLHLLHYAPAPERFKHIIERLKRVPTLIEQAQANLQDAPEIWNKVAREEDAGNLALIDSELRKDCPPALRAEYDNAANTALASLKAFDAWLRDTLSQKTSDWQLGADRYAKKFKFTLATGKTPDALLAEAEADLRKTRAEMVKLAAPDTVEAALAKVASRHATPATYMNEAKRILADATAFVKEKDLLTLPARTNLQVIDTPEFMRGTYSVGGFNSAPALEPQLGAFYWVTPIPATWPQARIDSKLREYNTSGLTHLTVHEAMPGHYVQGEYANDIEPRSRRLLRMIFGNGAYVEGWAVYTQQLMAEQGYQGDTLGYRLTLAKQMLRVLGNTILDVRLQTKGMTDAQAMDLMIKDTYQETEEATAKLQRAKLSSCQLPTYYAGYTGWIAVRAHAQAKAGSAFSLKQFHEAALREGAVSLPVLDQLLNR
jgi:uncharacterized protein (DUF885 family)